MILQRTISLNPLRLLLKWRYYIAIRKKVSVQGIEKQIVPLPDSIREKK